MSENTNPQTTEQKYSVWLVMKNWPGRKQELLGAWKSEDYARIAASRMLTDEASYYSFHEAEFIKAIWDAGFKAHEKTDATWDDENFVPPRCPYSIPLKVYWWNAGYKSASDQVTGKWMEEYYRKSEEEYDIGDFEE